MPRHPLILDGFRLHPSSRLAARWWTPADCACTFYPVFKEPACPTRSGIPSAANRLQGNLPILLGHSGVVNPLNHVNTKNPFRVRRMVGREGVLKRSYDKKCSQRSWSIFRRAAPGHASNSLDYTVRERACQPRRRATRNAFSEYTRPTHNAQARRFHRTCVTLSRSPFRYLARSRTS